MYAKVFTQILDSSLAENYQIRHVFEDLLKLADIDGVVDMTAESIARRLNMPVEIVLHGIQKLQEPDPESRTADHGGRRIILIDEHRSWGWLIVNYANYRKIASDEQRREKTRIRVARFKLKKKGLDNGNASVTHGDATNAIQRQRQRYKEEAVPASRVTLAAIQKIFEAWNEIKGIKQCILVSDKRKRTLQARLCESFFLDNWEAALAKIKVSGFCHGKGNRGWVASFDWFIQPDSCIRVMEGKYDDSPELSSNNHGQRPLSLFDLKTIIAAKETQAQDLKNRHCSEGPINNTWNSEESRLKFKALRAEIKEMTGKIAAMG